MNELLSVLKILLAGASFAGLCGLVRDKLRIESAFAPLLTACCVIAGLMLAGAAHLLYPGWLILYIAGFLGLIWRVAVRKRQPCWQTVAVLAAVTVYCLWHFSHAYYTGNDSVSHWGMVVKYMLRTNRFPDNSTQLIFFQTYPLGSGVFLYYLCRGTVDSEGAYLASMLLLYAITLLPLLAFARRNRAMGIGLAGLASALIIAFSGVLTTIQVDRLLGFMCFGATAIIAYYAEEPRKALPAAALLAAVLVFIKASGIYFSALIVLFMLLAQRRKNASRRTMLHTCLALLLAIGAAFALWQLHLKLAYPGASHSKHAVSLENYVETARGKSMALAWMILKGMLRRLIRPEKEMLAIYIVIIFAYIASLLLAFGAKEERALWMSRLKAMVLTSVAVYATWYAMIFLTYIFSMPTEEAQRLASVKRYEMTALVLIASWQAMFLIACMCRKSRDVSRKRQIAMACGILVVAVALAGGTSRGRQWTKRLVLREKAKPEPFTGLLTLREQQKVPEESSYMIFALHDSFELQTALYATKYEFFSNDIMEIGSHLDSSGYDPEAYYVFTNVYMHSFDCEEIEDMEAVLADHIDDYDYLLVYSKDEAFETALSHVLEHYSGNTQVYYAY